VAEIPRHIRDPLLREFRHAVLAGAPMFPASRGRRTPPPSTPAGTCWSSAATARRRDPVLRRHADLADEQHQRARRAPRETRQKISGRLTSEDITQDQLDIRSYIDTARKHGCNVMDILRSAMTGTPWSPPVPAPT
jgi:transposase